MIGERWRADVQRIPIVEVAAALQIERHGREGSPTFTFGHACDGEHSSGGGTIFVGARTNRLICRRCNGHEGRHEGRFDGCDLIAVSLGLPHRAERPLEEWARIREVAAAHGWCTPDPKAAPSFDLEVWRRERAARERERAEERRRRERQRQRGAIDVAAAWSALSAGRIGHDIARKWMLTARGLPAGLAEHLPVEDLAAVPSAWPELGRRPHGASDHECAAAEQLLGYAAWLDRRVLVAIRDVHGRRLSAKMRWHRPEPVPAGRLKSVDLPAEIPIAGSMSAWDDHVGIFGDLVLAVAKARRGEPVIFVEGEVDWIIAAAALRKARIGYALGAPGVGVQPRIAAALARALRSPRNRPIKRPTFLILPDRDKVRPDGSSARAAERAAWACHDALRAIGTPEIRRTGADDFNDFITEQGLDAEGVVDFLLGGER